MMINGLPPEAVFIAAARERRMIEEDLSCQRALPSVEAMSVLNFCRFIETASAGGIVLREPLPINHIDFYRKTIARLIKANELPMCAHRQFDIAFSEESLRAFAN